jgi:hypothetical protein
MWYVLDGASAHFGRAVRDVAVNTYHEKMQQSMLRHALNRMEDILVTYKCSRLAITQKLNVIGLVLIWTVFCFDMWNSFVPCMNFIFFLVTLPYASSSIHNVSEDDLYSKTRTFMFVHCSVANMFTCDKPIICGKKQTAHT